MKRALAVFGFTMLGALVVLCNISNSVWVTVVGITAAVTLILSLIIKPVRRHGMFCCMSLAVIFALISLSFSNQIYIKNISEYSQGEHIVSGSLSSLPYVENGKRYCIIKSDIVDGQRKTVKIKLELYDGLELSPTDDFTVKVETFTLGNDDESMMDYYRAKNLCLGAKFNDANVEIHKGAKLDFSSVMLLLRSKMANEIYSHIPNDYGAIICGILLGEKVNLSPHSEWIFRVCGISHLFAVSGMHMSIWSSLIYLALRKTKLKPRISVIISILFCLCFIVITGANPPVVRAGFMMIIYFSSKLLYTDADAVNSIGAATSVLLLTNPFNALSVSLWLSILATIGILVTERDFEALIYSVFKIKNKNSINPIIKGIVSILCVTLSVGVLTIPVYIFAFGNISFLSVPSNIIMVSLGSLCMELSGIAAILNLVGLSFLGTPLMNACAVMSKTLLNIAQSFSKFRFALLPVNSNVSKLLFIFAVAVIILVYLLSRKKIKPTGIVALLLCVSLVFANISLMKDDGKSLNIYIKTSYKQKIFLLSENSTNFLLIFNIGDFAEKEICNIMNKYGKTRLDYAVFINSEDTYLKTEHIISVFNPGKVMNGDFTFENTKVEFSKDNNIIITYKNKTVSIISSAPYELGDMNVCLYNIPKSMLNSEKPIIVCNRKNKIQRENITTLNYYTYCNITVKPYGAIDFRRT